MSSDIFASLPMGFFDAPRFQSSPTPGPFKTERTASYSPASSLEGRGARASIVFLKLVIMSAFEGLFELSAFAAFAVGVDTGTVRTYAKGTDAILDINERLELSGMAFVTVVAEMRVME